MALLTFPEILLKHVRYISLDFRDNFLQNFQSTGREVNLCLDTGYHQGRLTIAEMGYEHEQEKLALSRFLRQLSHGENYTEITLRNSSNNPRFAGIAPIPPANLGNLTISSVSNNNVVVLNNAQADLELDDFVNIERNGRRRLLQVVDKVNNTTFKFFPYILTSNDVIITDDVKISITIPRDSLIGLVNYAVDITGQTTIRWVERV